MADCVFCKIAQKEISSEIVHENEEFMVFHDIHPKAPLHLLVIPKKHIESVDHITEDDKELMGKMMLFVASVAEKQGVKGGYKLQVNVGRKGGQEIDHLHIHLLADKSQETF